MRRHTILTVVSLVLGASTAWLAIELHAARQALAEMRGPSAPTTPAPAMFAAATDLPAPEVQASPVAMSPPPSQPARPRDPMQAQNEAMQRAATRANNARVRAWLVDPEKRARTLAEYRKSHERDFPRQLLDLDDDDYTRTMKRDIWLGNTPQPARSFRRLCG